MGNEAVPVFLDKADKFREADGGPFVWQISIGSARRSRIREPGADGPLEEWDRDRLEDRLDALLVELEHGPETWAWIELRAHNGSKVLAYVSVDIRNPEAPPAVVRADDAMAGQLVKTNDQLIGLLLRKDKEVTVMGEQLRDLAILAAETVGEAQAAAAVDSARMMEAVLAQLGPLVPIVLAKMAATSAAKKSTSSPDGSSSTRAASSATVYSDDGEQLTELDEAGALDAALDVVCTIAAARPDLVTGERIARLAAVAQSAGAM